MAEERGGRQGARLGSARPAFPRFPLLLLLLTGTCTGDPPGEESLPRRGRFAIFRDLVLFERPEPAGGAFFMDRFETTRGDWADYLQDLGVRPEPRWLDLWGGAELDAGGRSRPMARVTLGEARDFATWRFCRLPRLEEWLHAATDGGRYEYPWGSQPRPTWTNTADLGLSQPTAVGTFESGRRGDGPYDLVGNVSEWTETPTFKWFVSDGVDRLAVLDFRSGVQRLDRTLGRAPLSPRPYPAFWILAAHSEAVPRLVVGWNFNQSPQPPRDPAQVRQWERPEGWLRQPDEWGDTVGLRVVADPEGLLRALLKFDGPLTEEARRYLRRFLGREVHRAVLREAWDRLSPPPAGPLAAFLAGELGP